MSSKRIGIYLITCTENGKKYVGQSIDLKRRWNQHIRKPPRQMQEDFDKYGRDTFTFEIIEECDESELTTREDYYLDVIKPEYNIKTEGNAISEKARQKLSVLHTGKKRPDISKPVKCVELDRIFPSLREAAEFCGVPSPNLSALLAGKGRTLGGYHWIWAYDDPELEKAALDRIAQMPEGHKPTEETREKQRQAKLGKVMSAECCLKMKKSHTGKKWKPSTYEKRCRKIRCIETGEIFPSIKAAAEEYDLNAPNISAVLAGKLRSIKGCSFEYVDDNGEPVHKKASQPVRCIETNQIFKSMDEAGRIMNIDSYGIGLVLRGKRENVRGYHFEFIDKEG